MGILEFVDPKGKQTLPFENVMENLKLSREDVEAEAKEFAELLGTDTIPVEHFTLREAKRGRPKKESTGEEEPKEKKKRGRPVKTLKVVQSSVGSDLIADLVNGAEAESDSESVVSSTSSRGRPRLTDEEKAARDQEKADKKAAKAQAKIEKEAATKAAKEAKAAAKAEKEASAKAEKEAKAAAKAQKDAEKEAAKAAKEAEQLKVKQELSLIHI